MYKNNQWTGFLTTPIKSFLFPSMVKSYLPLLTTSHLALQFSSGNYKHSHQSSVKTNMFYIGVCERGQL